MEYFFSGQTYHIDAAVIGVGRGPCMDVYVFEEVFVWNGICECLYNKSLWNDIKHCLLLRTKLLLCWESPEGHTIVDNGKMKIYSFNTGEIGPFCYNTHIKKKKIWIWAASSNTEQRRGHGFRVWCPCYETVFTDVQIKIAKAGLYLSCVAERAW